MSTLDTLIAHEVEKMKTAGYKRVAVRRTTEVTENNYFDIPLGNDTAIVESVALDARVLMDNNSRLMLCITSSSATAEEQFASIDQLAGFVAKNKMKVWVHGISNHVVNNTEPTIKPIKIHLIRITPIKD